MCSAARSELTLEQLKSGATRFAALESSHWEPSLCGVTDGKAIGTHFEQKFKTYLRQRYRFQEGSSASGIDFPELEVDIKVTSADQPQSPCPYRSARQKIYGLGYALLLFVYEKTDDSVRNASQLNVSSVIFVDKSRTADFQTTTGLRRIIENQGNKDDILAFFEERRLPLDEIEASNLASEILQNTPEIGYLTISNALQWRLQYSRVIQQAGSVDGVERLK